MQRAPYERLIKIEKEKPTKDEKQRILGAKATIYYPEHILTKFQKIIKQNASLVYGVSILNPYTEKQEILPNNDAEFTIRHLHILAQMPMPVSTDESGVSEEDILLMRLLVKATSISLITTVNDQPAIIVNHPMFLLDGTCDELGGVFFYPKEPSQKADEIEKNQYKKDTEKSKELYKYIFDLDRPQTCKSDCDWKPEECMIYSGPDKDYFILQKSVGHYDFDLFKQGIKHYFLMIFSVIRSEGIRLRAQGITNRIDFNFLQDAFVYFFDRNDKPAIEKYELAYLSGIKLALREIAKQLDIDKKNKESIVSSIASIALSGLQSNATVPGFKLTTEVQQIRGVVTQYKGDSASLNLNWAGCYKRKDPFVPHLKGKTDSSSADTKNVVATTYCASLSKEEPYAAIAQKIEFINFEEVCWNPDTKVQCIDYSFLKSNPDQQKNSSLPNSNPKKEPEKPLTLQNAALTSLIPVQTISRKEEKKNESRDDSGLFTSFTTIPSWEKHSVDMGNNSISFSQNLSSFFPMKQSSERVNQSNVSGDQSQQERMKPSDSLIKQSDNKSNGKEMGLSHFLMNLSSVKPERNDNMSLSRLLEETDSDDERNKNPTCYRKGQ